MIEDKFSPYSYEEAANYGNGFPKRGMKCKKCGAIVPQFKNFGENEIRKWKELLHTKSPEDADEYIMSITGCNPRWAKIWRLHPDGAKLKVAPLNKSATCPFCNKPLRTEKAKQCPHCFRSWRENSA